jgi:hypothetical protein
MFSKVYRKLVAVAALAVILTVLSPISRGTALDVLGGSLIPATPFDRQVMSAGGLKGHFDILTGSLASSEGLFMQARSMRYVADAPGRDYWQTPEETQARWAGDCEDKALWLFANLKKNGYSKVRLMVGRYRSSDRAFHVWVTLADDHDQVLVLDPTAQKKIWKAQDFGAGYYKALYSFDGVNRYRHDA